MPIPPCKYVVRKGQQPNGTNVLAYDPIHMGQKSDFDTDWEPLKGVPPKPDLRLREAEEVQAATTPRMANILEALEAFEKDKDFTPQGMPKIEILRRVVSDDITLDERNEAWRIFNKLKGRKAT